MEIRSSVMVASVALGALALPAAAGAQATPAPAAQTPTVAPLEIGAPAPDFALPGATRYGVLQQAVHLSNFKGKTVVLAFFFRARTRG